MFVPEHVGPPGEVNLQRFLEPGDVVGMHPLQPVFGTAHGGVRGEPDHRAPASGDVKLLAPQVPLPEPVVRTLRREHQPLRMPLDLVVGLRPLGDVVP